MSMSTRWSEVMYFSVPVHDLPRPEETFELSYSGSMPDSPSETGLESSFPQETITGESPWFPRWTKGRNRPFSETHDGDDL